MRWNFNVGRSGILIAAAIVLILPLPSIASAPEVDAGKCLYLVGAPPGLPQAADEETDGDAGLFDGCGNPVAGAQINEFGDNMLQAWVGGIAKDRPGNFSCRAFAWVSHAFVAGAGSSAPLEARIQMLGDYNGMIEPGEASDLGELFDTGATLELQLFEEDPATGRYVHITTSPIFVREIPEGLLLLDSEFGEALGARLVPGRRYSVRLYLEVWADGPALNAQNLPRNQVDFGDPFFPNRYANYDSIEVCLEEESDLSALEGLVEDLRQQMTQQHADLSAQIDDLRSSLEASIDDLATKDCEIMRLLLTPQGRRSTHCCEPALSFPGGKDADFCPVGGPAAARAHHWSQQARPGRALRP